MLDPSLGNKYGLGDKVRYMTAWGETKQPKEWEEEPYKVVSVIVDFYDMKGEATRLQYRVQRWEHKEDVIALVWERQLKPWVEKEIL